MYFEFCPEYKIRFFLVKKKFPSARPPTSTCLCNFIHLVVKREVFNCLHSCIYLYPHLHPVQFCLCCTHMSVYVEHTSLPLPGNCNHCHPSQASFVSLSSINLSPITQVRFIQPGISSCHDTLLSLN